MSPSSKERLDKLLVDKGLCKSRSEAQALILSGNVLIDNRVVDKPGMLCALSAELHLKERPKYISRGGIKLEKALIDFSIDITNRICLDVGASTGGFTDCLLQHGALHVHALDVGYGQLDWKLRQDPRVSVWEKSHILDFNPDLLLPSPNLATVDVSFISLKKVLPKVARCLEKSDYAEAKQIIALVKPQFEYRDYCNPKGFRGVVTDSEDLDTILSSLADDLIEILKGWNLTAFTESPIKGPKGNREFFFLFREIKDTEEF